MNLPWFHIPFFDTHTTIIELSEETSRHIVQVLRMSKDEQIFLTDGKGHLLLATITDAHKKYCMVRVVSVTKQAPRTREVTVAISLLKNTGRFEWFLEKATELGAGRIIPLICERTVKERFRTDRMQQICISAMLQSQQCWLPDLVDPTPFDKVVINSSASYKWIAHCEEGEKTVIGSTPQHSSSIILIGPEGDFTKAETDFAIRHDYKPVTLGETRLRTETAGIVAATLLLR